MSAAPVSAAPIPLDRLFHALADPTRLALVDRLGRGPATVSDLSGPLAMTMPAVLRHLRIMEEGGLVRTEKVGRVRTCSLEPGALRTVEAWVAARRDGWERRLDLLDALLTDVPD